MPDADNRMTIEIAIQLINEGRIDEAKEKLSGLRKETESQTESMPENLAVWSKYKGLVHEAGEETEGLHHQIHALSMLTRAGGPEIREFGHLLHFALNPMMLVGAAGAAGIELYFKWLEKSQEKMREMTAELQKHNDYLRDIIKLGGEVHELDVERVANLAKAREEADGLEATLKRQAQIQKEFDDFDAQRTKDRIEDRRTENKLIEDRVAMLEAAGVITKDQAGIVKLQLEHAENLNKIQDEVKGKKDAVVAAQNDEYRRVNALKAGGVDVGYDAAKGFQLPAAAIAAATDASATAAAQLAKDKALAGGAGQAELARLQGLKSSNEEEARLHGSRFNPATGNLVRDDMQKQNAAIDEQIAQQQALIDEANKRLASDAAAAEKADVLAKGLASVNAELAAMHDKIIEAQNAYGSAANAANKPGGAVGAENFDYAQKMITQLFKDGATSGSIFSGGTDAINQLLHMKDQTGYTPEQWLAGGNPQQKAYVQHLEEEVAHLQALETAVGNNGPQVIATLSKMIGHFVSVNGQLVVINRQLAAMGLQVQAGAKGP